MTNTRIPFSDRLLPASLKKLLRYMRGTRVRVAEWERLSVRMGLNENRKAMEIYTMAAQLSRVTPMGMDYWLRQRDLPEQHRKHFEKRSPQTKN